MKDLQKNSHWKFLKRSRGGKTLAGKARTAERAQAVQTRSRLTRRPNCGPQWFLLTLRFTLLQYSRSREERAKE